MVFGYYCYVCGYDKVIEYHHVIEKRDGGEHRLTNIAPLCPNHHEEFHKLNFDLSDALKKRDKVLKDIMEAQ